MPLSKTPAHATVRASTQSRQKMIVGKPPRIPARTGKDDIKAAMDLTVRLREAALPGAPPLTVAQMPEIMTTLTCHAALWEQVARVSIQLLGHGALNRRDAELAILRTAWLCQAPYEWAEHVVQAKNAGVTVKEIERLISGSAARGWSARDRSILRAVEELHEDAMVSDTTWAALAKSFDDKQLFELMGVGWPVHVGGLFSKRAAARVVRGQCWSGREVKIERAFHDTSGKHHG